MEVKDYLLEFTDDAQALTAASPWMTLGPDTDEEGNSITPVPYLKTPTSQSAMRLVGYSDIGTPPTINQATGEMTDVGTPPTLHGSVWWIITLPEPDDLPDSLSPFVVTSGLRSLGLPLPAGVGGFQSMIAGIEFRA